MAHFPRWINHPEVDSSAMVAAHTTWYQQQPVAPTPLPMIDHRSPSSILIQGRQIAPQRIPTPGTYSVPCAQEDCVRCLSGRGGYQFRWYSQLWYARYVDLARPGAWTLTGPKPVADPEARA